MYLTEQEVNSVLESSYYTDPVTETVYHYRSYRGRAYVNVFTLRFNITRSFNESFVARHLLERLPTQYALQSNILGSIQYDLLLVNADRTSFYIWRANSNRVHFNEQDEIRLSMSYANLMRFCQDSLRFHTPDLNAYFKSSNVSIDRVLALVYTFVN